MHSKGVQGKIAKSSASVNGGSRYSLLDEVISYFLCVPACEVVSKGKAV